MEQKAFSDWRPSMKKNVLLIEQPVGHRAPSTYDLPPSEFRYGIVKKSNGSVADCFRNYDAGAEDTEPRSRCLSSRRNTNRTDFIETNKQALKSGCITSRDFREFKEEHNIMVKQTERVSDFDKDKHHRKVSGMVHGISTPYISEMKDCLTYKTLNDALEKAVTDREINKEKARLKKKMKPNLKTGARSTKASRGHTFKPAPPPTEAQTFKIKRFRDINRYAIDDKWN